MNNKHPETPARHEPDLFSVSLDGLWNFRIDPEDEGLSEQWYDPDSDHGVWSSVRIPVRWNQYDLEEHEGIAWYAKRFERPADSTLKYGIVFEAIDDSADIWFNGFRIGSNKGYGQRFHFDISALLRNGRNVLTVRIEDLGGDQGIIRSVLLVTFRSEADLLRSRHHSLTAVHSADWVRDAVIYQVYLRSFSSEGSFRALEQRLVELSDLGVNVLWLMPVHPVGVDRRKGSLGSPYAVRDYYAVNPEFGSILDFRSLVDAVHRHGMKVIIDLVINHTSWDNDLIREHPDWYSRNIRGEISSPNAAWNDVAQLDYSVNALRDWMKEMMLYWIRDENIDGFRCDVAELVPLDFWQNVIPGLRKFKPVMMLSEGTDPEQHIDAFDITYAWNTYDILDPVLLQQDSLLKLDESLKREYHRFPPDALRLRFTTNHDKNLHDGPALLRYGSDGAKAAAVLLHTLPGVPLIYNGQETGSDRKLGLFEKADIVWKDAYGFRELYTTLNDLRRDCTCLRRGDMQRVGSDGALQPYTFLRVSENEDALVLVNLHNTAVMRTFSLPSAYLFEQKLARGTVSTEKDTVFTSLPAYGYWIGIRKYRTRTPG